MKSDIPNTDPSQSINKRDVVVYGVALFGTSQIMIGLCEAGLHKVVLLSALAISVGNLIYYGVVWKDLQKSFRLGLAILFSIIAFVSYMLYKSVSYAKQVSQWDLPVEVLGIFVGMLTIVFIYNHKTPGFWNWV